MGCTRHKYGAIGFGAGNGAKKKKGGSDAVQIPTEKYNNIHSVVPPRWVSRKVGCIRSLLLSVLIERLPT